MNWIRFIIFIITIGYCNTNSCPITHCTCDSMYLLNCIIKQNEDQIDCNQKVISSNEININLELRQSIIDRTNPLFINTKKCRMKTLKISTNLIPANRLISNINSLTFLIIEGILNLESKFESNINNFLYGIKQLNRLKIENINLIYWSKQNLETCDSLVEMEFKNLKIEHIDYNSFINCKKLTKLTMRFNNLLKIYSSTFNGLNRLLSLILSSNQCEELMINDNGWWELRNLTKLDLSYNKLRKLKIRTFIGLTKLEQLNLNSNPIDFIDYSAFEGLTNLKLLNLKNNPKLKTIDLNYFVLIKSSLINLMIDKEFLICFYDQTKLKQFSITIQQTLQNINDCEIPSIFTAITSSINSSINTSKKLNEQILNPTLIIIVAVLVTLLIVFIFVGIFIIFHCKKKIRKYKSCGSDKLTSHSSSSKHLYLNGYANTTDNRNHLYLKNTSNGSPMYSSSPVLISKI